MFELCIENHEVFGSLTQNCLQLDKDKSTVSIFSVILINKYVVITIQKSSYVESFSFGQQRFVFAHLFPDISIIAFPEPEKKFLQRFCSFSVK